MKTVLFLALMAFAVTGCDTPENTTGTDAPPPTDSEMSTDSAIIAPQTDTVTTMPVDTTSMPTMPTDTSTMPAVPANP